MALSDRSRFVYKRWHRGDYESIPQEIEALLEREKEAIQEQFRRMAQKVLTKDEFRRVLERLLPDPKPLIVDEGGLPAKPFQGQT
jgi:hypothetical protein